MPQFEMNGKHETEFRKLDSFTQGFIEAMFFTDTEPGTTRETWNPETQSSLPGDVGFDDIEPESLARMIDDCKRFQELHATLLERAYDDEGENNYDDECAGHDFWLTRNGHGAGFWSRDFVDDSISEALSAVCGWRSHNLENGFGEVSTYLSDSGLVCIL